jgi:cellulose biosynthesis protein BcsQ
MIIASVTYKGGQGKSFWSAVLADFLGPKTEILDLDTTNGDSHTWAQAAGRPSRLILPHEVRQALAEAAAREDWTVVDCPPHEGAPTRAALECAAMALVPVVGTGGPEAAAFGRIAQAIREARTLNPTLKAAAILTLDRETRVAASFRDMLQEWHRPKEGQAFIGVVPRLTALAEAIAQGQPPQHPTIDEALKHLRRFAAK